MTTGRPSGGSERVVASVRRVDAPGTGPRAAGRARRRDDRDRLLIRPAEAADVAACARVWEASLADHERRLDLPVVPVDLGPTERLIGHVRETDPGLCWVAVRSRAGTRQGAEVVAFASAHVRGDVWFLAMLFVLPEEQASGLGRRLLERVLPGGRVRAEREATAGGRVRAEREATAAGRAQPTIHATATDSSQPISNALYARHGIVPRLPVWRLTGRPDRRAGRLPELPHTVRPVPFDEVAAGPPDGPGHRRIVDAVGAIDRGVLGYEHPADHRYLRREGRVGHLYLGADELPVGYGYASPVGRIGPIAALEPTLLPAIAGHLLRSVEARGASTLWVPGAAGDLFRLLLDSGFRLDGFPALLCWDRPFGAFDRYVPISLALL